MTIGKDMTIGNRISGWSVARILKYGLAQNKDVLEPRRIEVERTKAERWNGQLPQNIYAGAPIPFLQVQTGR